MGWLWREDGHRMAAPHGPQNHEMSGNEEVSDHTMPGGHGVVMPGCGWHGACMERPSIHHNTSRCAQVGVSLDAGGLCWPGLCSCSQLVAIMPHTTTDKPKTPAA